VSAASESYPLAFPWAVLMDEEDFYDFRADLVAATAHRPQERALAEMEKAVATWRMIAEAQHAHNTAPGPSAEESADRLTRFFAPTQALREEPHDSPLHHEWRLGRDLPEPAHPVPCRFPKSPGCTCGLTGADVEAAGGAS